MQTLSRCPYSPRVQLHASAYLRRLKILITGSQRHTHRHRHTHTHTTAHTHTHTHTHTHNGTHTQRHTHTHNGTHKHTRARARAHTHKSHPHARTNTHIRANALRLKSSMDGSLLIVLPCELTPRTTGMEIIQLHCFGSRSYEVTWKTSPYPPPPSLCKKPKQNGVQVPKWKGTVCIVLQANSCIHKSLILFCQPPTVLSKSVILFHWVNLLV